MTYRSRVGVAGVMLATALLGSTSARIPMPAVEENSAEHAWLKKKVHASRVLDDMSREDGWVLDGKGRMSFLKAQGGRALRVDVELGNRKAMPVATARRVFAGEDWTAYNRLSFWVRTDVVGIPMLTLMVSLRDGGKVQPSAVHLREATHHVSVPTGRWTRIVWEIPHLQRGRVTGLSFRPWVNKIATEPWDRVAYEVRQIELERVDEDHHEGWNVAKGRIAYSHTGYLPEHPKQAIASGLSATEFEVRRGDEVVLRKRVTTAKTRLGAFQVLDFTEVRRPGEYWLKAGTVRTKTFRIGGDVWDSTLAKTLNFFYGERCGVAIPGLHEACHRDWQAVLGEKKIIMNGGWHDAGDLSQGLVNTGEATHAMFSLAAAMKGAGRNPELLRMLVDEAKWGLDWIHKVRFDGGFRIGFASMNVWTNGVIGDEDDRARAALNNPTVNYIAAAAGAAAYRFLKDSDPVLASRSLAIAEDDWRHAVGGVESPETQSTPAFASSEMELAAMGVIASVELYKATQSEQYARKAEELSRVVSDSQQKTFVGTLLPLAGFFYTGPDRANIFHQFHRGNDQAPALAMAMLCETFPNHADWMKWYSTAAMYGEFQKAAATSTAPYGVLPAYVYAEDEWLRSAEGDRYGSSREVFRKQVLAGMDMGGGYRLKAFPVWFTRRGNYGVLLSQAKGLSAAARLRGDREAEGLAQRQLEWVVGLNPFAQSTMWGEGYDFAAQYSVSVGDITGSLPVGMMTREDSDVPYWPASNSFVFKEVWVHPSVRWLSILEDLLPKKRDALEFKLTRAMGSAGDLVITLEAKGTGKHTFALRAENLDVNGEERALVLKPGVVGKVSWKARVVSGDAPWIAVAIADGDASKRRDVAGFAPHRTN